MSVGVALIAVGLVVFALGSPLGWILGLAGLLVVGVNLWERG